MTRILAIDAGTSSIKVAVLDDGVVVASAERSHPIAAPRAGWVEQHPDAWWDATVDAVGHLRDRALDALEAVAVTGQMQDLICLGHDGRVLRPAILYSDRRAAAEHDELCRELGGRWPAAVGATPDPSNVAAKWRWLTGRQPDVVAACRLVLFGAHSFLVHRLTGDPTCDPTTAATTGLYDIGGGTWWPEIVERIAIPVPTLSVVTATRPLLPAAAAVLGLTPGLPVVHANGDAVATTVGLVGSELDRPYVYLGSSGWAAMATDSPRPAPGVVVLPGLGPDHWVSAAPMPAAGLVLDWARDVLLGGVDGARFDELAGATCAAASDVLFVPHLDGTREAPDAAGALVGLRRSTTPSVIAAAVVEGLGHAVRQLLRAVAPRASHVALCGGAARSAALRRAIADVTGCPVDEVGDEHAALAGAGVAAHLALGVSPPRTHPRRTIEQPDPGRHEAHSRTASRYDRLCPTLAQT